MIKVYMEKKFYFVSGLPRSGSTLLMNILAQNPRFGVSATSGIMDIMFGVRNNWDSLVEFKAHPDEAAKKRVIKGILENYYATSDKPVVFDKSRGWLSLIQMYEYIFEKEAKIIVPVRDMRDVVASFEKLWRANSMNTQIPQESQFYFDFQSVEGRVKVWLRPDQPVGLAYNRIVDAIKRGFSDRLFFVRFEDLTTKPKETMEKIYAFLDEPDFEHDFNTVKQVTWEDDEVHGIKGLHDIRQKVEPIESSWKKTLGPFAKDIGNLNFWDTGNSPNGIS